MKYRLLYLITALLMLSNVAFAQADKDGYSNGLANDATTTVLKKQLNSKLLFETRKNQINKLNSKLMAEARRNQCAFRTDSDLLLPGCDFKLNQLAGAVMDARSQLVSVGISGYKFEVSAHMDSTGNPEHSRQLTERRAEVIVKELVSRGVPSDEIFAVGMGFEQPLVNPDNTPAKQTKNRRYEIRIRM